MSRERLDLGKKGEDMAQAYLCRQGYRLLERSYRCKLGEADLIMQNGNTIVFVEVKTRSSNLFGTPQEAVDARKQKKLVRVAQSYLQERRLGNVPSRFDVVAVTGDDIRHIPDAFRA